MQIVHELPEQTEKLSPKQRVLRGLGSVVCAGAGIAVLKYLPYDVHDSMAFQPMLAAGLIIGGSVLGLEAARGEQFTTPAEDSE